MDITADQITQADVDGNVTYSITGTTTVADLTAARDAAAQKLYLVQEDVTQLQGRLDNAQADVTTAQAALDAAQATLDAAQTQVTAAVTAAAAVQPLPVQTTDTTTLVQ